MNFWNTPATSSPEVWPTPGGESEQRRQLLGDVRTAVQLVLASCPSVFSDTSSTLTEAQEGGARVAASTKDDGEVVYDHSVQLNALSFALEKVLRFGMRDRSTFWKKKDYWNFLKKIAKINPSAASSVTTVENLSSIKTPTGRGRAWIRVALVEKQLSNYLRQLAENRHYTLRWFEQAAVLRNEELELLCGMLQTLHVVEFSLCLKDVDFDNLPVDLEWYLHNTQAKVVSAKRAGDSPSAPPQTPPPSVQSKAQHTAPAVNVAPAPVARFDPEPEDKLNAQVELLKEQLEALRRELEAKKQVALTLIKDREQSTTRIEGLERDILDLRREMRERDDGFQKEKGTYELQLRQTLVELEALKMVRTKETESVDSEVLRLKDEVANLKSEKEQLQQELRQLESRYSAESNATTRATERSNALEKESAELRLQLQELSGARQQLEETVRTQERALGELKERLAGATASSAKLEGELHQVKHDLLGARQQIEQTSCRNIELETNLKLQEAKATESQQLCVVAQEEVVRMRELSLKAEIDANNTSQQLRLELVVVKQQLEDQQNRLFEAQKAHEFQQVTLDKALEDSKALSAKIEQQQAHIERLKGELSTAEEQKQELASAKEQLGRQTELIAKLEGELNSAFQGTEQEQQVVQRLRDEIHAARSEQEISLSTINRLKGEHQAIAQEREQERQRMTETVSSLEDTVREREKQIEDLHKDLQSLDLKLRSQQELSNSLQEEKEGLCKDIVSAKQSEDRFRVELSEARDREQTLMQELQAIKSGALRDNSALEQVKGELEEKNTRVESLLLEISASKEREAHMSSQLQVKEKQVEELEASLYSTRAELSRFHDQHSAKESSLSERLEGSLLANVKLEEELRSATRDIEELRALRQSEQQEIAALRTSLADARGEYERRLEDLSKKQSADLLALRSAFETESSVLQSQLQQSQKQFKEENERLRLELERQGQERSVHESARQEQQKTALQQEKEALVKELSLAKEQISTLSATSSAAEVTRTELQAKLHQLQDELSRVQKEWEEKSQKHKARVRTLEEKLRATEAANSSLEQQLRQQESDLESKGRQLQELERSALVRDELIAELRRSLEETKLAKDRTEERVSVLEQAKEDKTLQLGRLEQEAKESGTLRFKVAEQERELKELQEALSQRKLELEQSTEQSIQLQDAVKRLVETKRSLEQQLLTQSSTQGGRQLALEGELREATETIARLQQKQTLLETTNAELLAEKRKVEQADEASRQQFQAELARLNTEKQLLEQELNDLKIQNDTMMESIAQMNSRMEEAVVEKMHLKEQRKGPAPMIADSLVQSCMECKVGFTLTRRKHHCRYCGRVLCNACSNNKVIVTSLDPQNPSRLCTGCYLTLKNNR